MRNLKTVGAIAAGALAATALTGVAVATTAIADDDPTTSNNVSSDSDADGEFRRGPKGHGGPRGGEFGMLHGEIVVETEDGVYVTQQVQRGEATAVSDLSITVVSEDGYEATYAIDSETQQKRDREDGAAQVGDTVHVVAVVDGSTTTTKVIMAMSPEAAAELQEQRDAMQQWMSQRPEDADREELREWMSQRPEGLGNEDGRGPGQHGGMRGPRGMGGERPQAPADATSFGA